MDWHAGSYPNFNSAGETVIGAPPLSLAQRNMNPCPPCRTARKKCDGGYPCDRCQVKQLQAYCIRPPLPTTVAVRDGGYGADNDFKFVIEDPSGSQAQANTQRSRNRERSGLDQVDFSDARPRPFFGQGGIVAQEAPYPNMYFPAPGSMNPCAGTNGNTAMAFQAPAQAPTAGALGPGFFGSGFENQNGVPRPSGDAPNAAVDDDVRRSHLVSQSQFDANQRVSSMMKKKNLLLPDHALPFDINDLYDALVRKGAYSEISREWTTYPFSPRPKLQDNFYKHLLNVVDQILRDTTKTNNSEPSKETSLTEAHASTTPLSCPTVPEQCSSGIGTSSIVRRSPEQLRRWTSCTKDRAPKGEDLDCKNELVLVDQRTDLNDLHWSQVVVPHGLQVDQDFSIRKIWEAARNIFQNQSNRRFVLGVKVAGTSLVLICFDRSGVLSSRFFDVNKDPKTFLRVVIGLVYVEDKYLGYDTSFSFTNDRDHALLNSVRYTVEDFVYAISGTIGRGTVCLKVTNGEGNATYALKDAWIDVSLAQKEVQVLRELNELKITHIPVLKDHAIVQIDGVDDSTQNIRRAIEDQTKHLPADQQPEAIITLAEDRGKGRKKTKKHRPKDAKNADQAREAAAYEIAKQAPYNLFLPRMHYRLLLWPYGRHLTDFRCLEELLLGIRDIVGVIEQLHANGYLHRDVSIGNVVLANGDENPATSKARGSFVKRLEGFLIDYDHATKIANADQSTLTDKTGTMPFMAIELLNSKSYGEPKAHTYYHDLESLFYVLCWVCMISAGPGKDRDSSEYKDSFLYKWNIPDKSEESMAEVAQLKRMFTAGNDWLKIYGNRCFHEYFKPILGCLYGFRVCLFPPEIGEFLLEHARAEAEQLEGTTNPDEIRKLRAYRNAQPLRERKAQWVFEEFYSVIDETISSLPDEHKLASLSRRRSPPSFEPSVHKVLKRKSPEDDQKPDCSSSRNKKCRRHKSDPEEYTL
ncbi:hypothetical protein SCHPADRAFT_940104 [Schizopora paradoxa]|uniref:Uncharacterized protein n=1 Tax=Schizopora paradoxa TaxID=27342 RepID=A0A0H2RP73_9AGAM|nr:hypothetical protein SCHPADRAFT_940104 [Schizopora paradoxa]